MRILFVSAASSTNDQIEKAFIENGAEVFRFDERINTFLPSFLNSSKLPWQFIRKFPWLKRINNRRWNERLIGLCRSRKPDILFATKGMIIYPETLIKIKAMGILLVNWFFENVDHHFYNRWFLKTCRYYDYFFNYDPEIAKKYRFSFGNLKYLPVAVNPDFYRVSSLSEKDKEVFSSDVCFIGALYPEREKLLSEVKKTGANLKIFGWPKWKDSPLAENYYGPLSIDSIAKAYYSAKISLNSNLQPQNGGVNLKTFEIPASGGFQISDNQPDLKNIFKIGEEIETYETISELLDKIKFYLSNEDKRNQIAEAGHKRVLKDHTLSERIKKIIETITHN